MTVNGSPIGDYSFKPSATTVRYTSAYEEEQARIYAELSIAEFEALPGTPMWIDPNGSGMSKSHYIILYRNSQLIPAAIQDAHVRQMERDAKRPRR